MSKLGMKGLALAAAMGLASAGATAGSITFMDTWDFGSKKVTDTRGGGAASKTLTKYLSFDRFDASMGQLTSVSLRFESDWSYKSKMTARDWDFRDDNYQPEYAAGKGWSSQKLTFSLVDPASSSKKRFDRDWSSCSSKGGNYYAGCQDRSSSSGTFDRTLDLTGISLNDWINPVGDAVNVKLIEKLTSKVVDCGYGDNCYQSNYKNDWSGKAWLTYKYTKVAEPGSLALLGLGLAGLGVARRKQSKS